MAKKRLLDAQLDGFSIASQPRAVSLRQAARPGRSAEIEDLIEYQQGTCRFIDRRWSR
jgi:hypothetical protein